MKRIAFLLFSLLFLLMTIEVAPDVAASLPSEPLAQDETPVPVPDFVVQASGGVTAGERHFTDLSAYFQSDYFRENELRCGTETPPAVERALAEPVDCSLTRTIIQNEYWPGNQAYFVIPVVVHIIHKTDGTGNLTDQRVYNQIQVLNEDFGATAFDASGVDVRIQFSLDSITRTANDTWHSDASFAIKGDYKTALAKDPENYLNVYVNSANGLLGYAYFPQSDAGAYYDGVVVNYVAFGGRNEGAPPYNQGRTLVHEVGHYLGLFHTFQGNSCANGYTSGDLVVDTPSENTDHYGCTQTFSCGTADPINNFMNYTDDACMTEFTSEQANRAVCSLVNYRSQLYTLMNLTELTERAFLPTVLAGP